MKTKKAIDETIKSDDFAGYSKSELDTLSVYELREISKVLALERDDSTFYFKYIHFVKKVALIDFITGTKKARQALIDSKTDEMNRKLAETCKKANVKRDASIQKAKNFRKRAYERLLKKFNVKNAKQVEALDEVSENVKYELNNALAYVKNFDAENSTE